MMENGIIITCMAAEYIPGKMEGSMRDYINMTKNTDSVYILGLMEEDTRVIGLMENNMEKENIFYQTVQLKSVCGKMVNK